MFIYFLNYSYLLFMQKNIYNYVLLLSFINSTNTFVFFFFFNSDIHFSLLKVIFVPFQVADFLESR